MNHKKITYNEQDIFLFDHRGLRGQKLLESVQTGTRMIIESESSEILALADFTGTYLDEKVITYLQSEEGKAAAAKAKKTATVGITGIKEIFMKTYNMVTKAGARNFPDQESAKKYLTS